MIQWLHQQNYKHMPWKNGQGQTAQIAIFPLGSDFAKNDFDWRVSSATVQGPGPFSKFENFSRILAIWQGEGLLLNGKKLLPKKVLRFSGSELMNCDLVNGPIKDLGVIYREDRVKVEFEYFEIAKNDVLRLSTQPSDTAFAFCAEGKLVCDKLKLDPGDVIRVDGAESLRLISGVGTTCLFFLRLSPIGICK